MAKRRTHGSDDYYDESPDNPIGLTSAFEVIHDPQSVQYDEGDEAIGLTEAFARVGTSEPPAWDEAGKWKDFDWDADWEGSTYDTGPIPAVEPAKPEGVPDQLAGAVTPDAAGQADGGEPRIDQAQPEPASVEFEISPNAPFNERARDFDVRKDLEHANAAQVASRSGKRGRHSAHGAQVSERMQRSHRTRRTLIVVVVLLVLALCALGFFVFRTVMAGQQQAANEVHEQVEAPRENETQLAGDDAVETVAQLADVPNLTGLLGKTSNKAVKQLGRGAFVSSNQKVKEKGSAIKTNLTVALADEPSDSKTGTPSVYLGLDKDDKIVQVGYSASASALGFGSLSFADAVNVEHVIEQTLRKVGVDVPDGSAVLPADSSTYVTYASDGKTVSKERCSFEGAVEVDGVPCTWSAVLSYDYTTQVITGNLSDTVRIIYVYLTQD